MSRKIPRIKIPIYQNQLDFVRDAIIKGELANGKNLDRLEEELKKIFDYKYVILTSNGFSAIFLTLQVLKSQKSEVTLPAISTCFSMVNAIKASKYNIKFADIDMETLSTKEVNQSKKSISLIPNHFGKIATSNRSKNNIFQIEDSCQSFLSSKNSKSRSDVMILSLYPTKLLNGIDGGVILTNNQEIYTQVKNIVYYDNQRTFEGEIAFNFKLNNINASFAMATLEHLDEIESYLVYIYRKLTTALQEKNISFLKMENNEVASRLILIFSNQKSKESAFKYFLEKNIDVSTELFFICPLEEQYLYPNANEIVQRSFSIPFHPLLTADELSYMENTIKDLKWN